MRSSEVSNIHELHARNEGSNLQSPNNFQTIQDHFKTYNASPKASNIMTPVGPKIISTNQASIERMVNNSKKFGAKTNVLPFVNN